MTQSTFSQLRNTMSPAFLSTVAALVLLLGLGAATLKDMLDGPDDWREEVTAAVTPEFPTSWASLLAYPRAARLYLKRRWALKHEIVRLDSLIKLTLFDHLPNWEVMQGRDGFLFLESDTGVHSYMGLPQLTDRNIDAWETYFQTLRRETDARDINFLFVFAPSKHAVYADKLPEWLSGAQAAPHRQHEILRMAQQFLDPVPVDFYQYFEAYRRANPDKQVYFSTDTHWNERGATLATQHVLKTIGLDLPVQPYTTERTQRGGDLARIVGMAGDMQEEAPVYPRGDSFTCRDEDGRIVALQTIDPPIIDVVRCVSDSGQDARLLVLMDSFGVATKPFLAQSFRETIFMRTDALDLDMLDDIDPDILMQFFAERKTLEFDPAVMIQGERLGNANGQP